MSVTPYLFFGGTCAEAFTAYQEILGGELALMRFSDAPDGEVPPGRQNDVLHGDLRSDTFAIMGSDDPTTDDPGEMNRVSVALDLPTEDEAKRVFAALADGGTVYQEVISTFFSPAFGIVVDRWGVHWMIMSEQPEGAQ